MTGPLPPVRAERATAGRGIPTAPRSSAPESASDGGDAIAAQRQAFDFEAAERAEILREHEILETLLMAQLKNEDEITKKWIALI